MIIPDDELNPFPWYRHIRETRPVTVDSDTGIVHVFSYDGVKRVLSDTHIFSSQVAGLGDHPLQASIAFRDPPDHGRLRALIQHVFTPASVAQLTPRITRIVHDLLDKAELAGTMDVATEFAQLPTTVIAELLGVPSSDREQFKQWSDAFMAGGHKGAISPPGMVEYFLRLIEKREQSPEDDLLSALITARIAEQRLSQREILGFCVLLLIAGNETSVNLITNTVWCLDEHPDVMDMLRTEPTRVTDAIEEVLRYRSPVRIVVRRAKSNTNLLGQDVQAGRIIQLWIGSANRDEAHFSSPDTFDIQRVSNQHLTFGYGIHFCMGAALARLEAKIVLQTMLDRFTQIRRRQDVILQPAGLIVYSVKHLPVTFSVSANDR